MSLFELTEDQTHEVEDGVAVGELRATTYTFMVHYADGARLDATVDFGKAYPDGYAEVNTPTDRTHRIPISRLPVCRRREDVARWAVVAALKREQA